ncbi:sugar transferase [Dorea formicigenerans]|uniref:Sugar transferase n=1 Tax=Dorea formicigenerans TaxID=39486 RepID=A0A412KPX0_9FIRM|nr:sugar transferase [Dorea formicigenerans]RGS70345.1 sugar transferase [Dorea formicigenerans]RGT36572.1 sugar transferase [Dorea formicigenerans]RHC45621.1 sugar transferase [Dorea formicigenerans]
MKKIPFAVVKMVNIVLLMIPFLICWTLYYEPRTTTVGSKQVSVLVMIIFFFICYYFGQRLDCFRVSILQIRDVIFGEVLAVMITDIIMYILIWMLSIHLPNLIPGLITWGGQCAIGAIWAYVMHQSYFSTHPPLRTIVIYDERMGMENLIHTYGLEKRFNIKTVYPVESIMDKLEVMEEFDAAFLCGIHSRERNIILKHCINHKIKLFMIPRIADVMMRGSEQIHMLHLPILKTQRYKPSIEYQIIKRTMDIVVSGIATIVLSPLFLITAIAVKSDGGPAFYKQKRLTKDGKEFEILKFRSMRVDAEKYSGAVLSAGENDPRITKVGRIIRACRLDELPQLLNILKGDMSLVGPRPERPELQKEIEKEVPEFGLRLQTKAGLTGYAQVYGKYNTTFYDKLLMDLMYISKPSILEDLTIMLATVKILTSKESTEGVGEGKDKLELRESK